MGERLAEGAAVKVPPDIMVLGGGEEERLFRVDGMGSRECDGVVAGEGAGIRL